MMREDLIQEVDLPLSSNIDIFRPEFVVLKILDQYFDIGSLCYSERSRLKREAGKPCGVVEGSLILQRPAQIERIITSISESLSDGRMRKRTVIGALKYLKLFLDWSDTGGFFDCLSGGDATRSAYHAWVKRVEIRFNSGEISQQTAYRMQMDVRLTLESILPMEGLRRGLRLIKKARYSKGGTEPASEGGFAHVLALNKAIFDGLCDLLLEKGTFPFLLKMPKSLGWEDCHLWVFPTNRWRLPPHLWGDGYTNSKQLGRVYDYKNGRIVSVDELVPYYKGPSPAHIRLAAARCIGKAKDRVNEANENFRDLARIRLGISAFNAFIFLFFANTGVNLSIARSLETDGEISASTLNQSYRSIKCRSRGAVISVICPVTFMPSLRRFMALRKFVLGDDSCPYLFFSLGGDFKAAAPKQISESCLQAQYYSLSGIDENIERITSRKIRATVEDYFRRNTDPSIAASIMGHSEDVANSNYLAGSDFVHKEEMTNFLNKVAEAARHQKIVAHDETSQEGRVLEEGGACLDFGHPRSLADHLPSPDCRQNCLFCANRVLAATELDTRKIASAAFLMEQLIVGPLSEKEFRVQIGKCDADLLLIAGFDGCAEMVSRVKREVYEGGELTPYFADKYQMLLELGVL